jgi:hypothetical protein
LIQFQEYKRYFEADHILKVILFHFRLRFSCLQWPLETQPHKFKIAFLITLSRRVSTLPLNPVDKLGQISGRVHLTKMFFGRHGGKQ